MIIGFVGVAFFVERGKLFTSVFLIVFKVIFLNIPLI